MIDADLDKELSDALSRKVGSEIGDIDIPLLSVKKTNRTTYSSKKKKYTVPMTYKELREKQKISENANLGPGSNYVQKPFGSQNKSKMTLGSKVEFKPNNNPGMGDYNTESGIKMIKPKIFEVIIPKEVKKKTPIDAKKEEPANDPGKYDKHLTPFASDIKTNITFGSKYQFKPDTNPPPGAYETDKGVNFISSRSRSVLIREDFIKQKRKPVPTPDPGQYDNHLIPFAADIKNSMTFGRPYEFVPNSNPPPGLYEPDLARELVSSRMRSAFIRKEVSPYRSPKHKNPDPGRYTEDVITFGNNVKSNPGMGCKYEFIANRNPPPVLYNIEQADVITMPKLRAAIIREDFIKVKRK
jgi:hypothetical protein